VNWPVNEPVQFHIISGSASVNKTASELDDLNDIFGAENHAVNKLESSQSDVSTLLLYNNLYM
jgi:hypothetical protein